MSIRTGFKKFTAWVKRKDPPSGPGPGGGPSSQSFEQARAHSDFNPSRWSV